MATQFSINDNKSWQVPFFTIWGGQAFSILGSQLVQFALIWYLTVQTESATVLATASMIGMLPGVILGPFVGTLVDRWNRRKIMILADSIIAAATLLLAVIFALGSVAIWQIYIVLFVRSLAGSFHGNAMTATTSLMVPIEKLTQIQGINQMLNGGLNIISAPLGALLLEALPTQWILAIDIGTAGLAILPLLISQVPQPTSINQEMYTVWQDFQSGFRYIISWPGLMIIGLMTVVINFTIIPAFSLLPLMVKSYFGGSAIHLSWIEAAMGIGVFSGGALLSTWGGFKRKILTSLFGLVGMGIGTLVFTTAPASAIWLAVGGALIVGLMQPITIGPFFAIIQTTVEPNMQARVFSLLWSVGAGMAPIGLMIAGPIADRFGIKAWFGLGGVACVSMAIIGLFMPSVMDIEEQRSILTAGAPVEL